MNTQGYAAYKKMRTENANPGQLIVMLYEGALRNLDAATSAIDQHNVPEANNQLIRAQDIVVSLNAGLNMEQGGQVAETLRSLYVYMVRRLVEANVQKDVLIVTEISGLLRDLLAAWKQIVYGIAAVQVDPAAHAENETSTSSSMTVTTRHLAVGAGSLR